ncbi:hypothetical protein HYY72_00715 [Candidatus Woesearchaeota archaeon]|nr:hypothetical protein [Candidatus Woesearchaeota archaeon]
MMPLIVGMLGAAGMIAAYFGLLTVTNSFSHAMLQFAEFWPWITAISIGFGIQMFLFSYAHRRMAARNAAGVAASGGISTGSMILCCAHHLGDAIPVLGVSAALIFFARYQTFFYAVAIFSNLIGITMMLLLIQKNKLQGKSRLARSLFRVNMETLRNITAAFAVVVLAVIFLVSTASQHPANEKTGSAVATPSLGTLTNSEGGVTIGITPSYIGEDASRFEIILTTHEGSMDFDMAKNTDLFDSEGNRYSPSGWEGSPPGGHHRSGVLSFPPVKKGSAGIRLVVRDVDGVPERAFSWSFK